MHLALEIGQREIRRVERRQYPLTFRRGLADAHYIELRVEHDRLSDQSRERRQIISAPRVDELALARVGHRHADLALAESLRLVLPSRDALEVSAIKPQAAAGSVRLDAGIRSFAIDNVHRHIRLASHRDFSTNRRHAPTAQFSYNSYPQYSAAGRPPGALADRAHVEPDLRAILVEPRRDLHIGFEIDHRPDRAIAGLLGEGQIRDSLNRGAVFKLDHQRTFAHHRLRSLRAQHQRRFERRYHRSRSRRDLILG